MLDITNLSTVENIDQIIIGALLIGAALFWWFFLRGGGGGATIYGGLTLSKYDINKDDPSRLVVITGRAGGVIGFLFNLVGLAQRYSVLINSHFVTIEVKGRLAEGKINVPIQQVTASFYGYTRPKWALIISLVAIFGAIALIIQAVASDTFDILMLLSLFVGPVIFYFFYWRATQIEVRVSAGDGFWGFAFAKGNAGSYQKAAETTEIINRLTYAANLNTVDDIVWPPPSTNDDGMAGIDPVNYGEIIKKTGSIIKTVGGAVSKGVSTAAEQIRQSQSTETVSDHTNGQSGANLPSSGFTGELPAVVLPVEGVLQPIESEPLPPDIPPVTTKTGTLTATVNKDQLKVYDVPFGKQTGSVPRGTPAVLTGRTSDGTWVRVRAKQPRWVQASYLTIDGDVMTLEVVA